MSTLTAPGQLELPLELFWQEAWLPTYPQATDDLALGIRRTSREQALTRAYIETNPRDLHSLLVTDIDHYDAVIRALWDTKHFRPNIITENPRNGHAHAIWVLLHPFPTTDYARRRPVYQAATITEGLRRYTDADAGYSGLITKNPLHEHWHTLYLHKHRFTFAELVAGLRGVDSYPERGWRTSKRLARTDYAGLGRNCFVFETVRIWAYPEVHHHLGKPESLAAPHTGPGTHARTKQRQWASSARSRLIGLLSSSLLSLSHRSKTRDLRASETRFRPPTPWAMLQPVV